jgi:predicted SnoaL-like aldol condensation-catalyzing enzyme
VQFLQLVAAGRIDDACQKHVDLEGKHHNPFFPAGFSAPKKAMIQNRVQFPNKQLIVNNVLGDGELVAAHYRIVLRPGETGMAAVPLFRFHGDKIVERWDGGQPEPTDPPNEDGAF